MARAIAIALITLLVALGGALAARRMMHAGDHATASALVAEAHAATAAGDRVTAVRDVERARMLEPRSSAVQEARASLHVVDPEPGARRAFRVLASDEWAAIAIAGAWAAAAGATLLVAARRRTLAAGALAGGLVAAALGGAGVALASTSMTSVVGSGGAPLVVAPYAGADVVQTLDAATVVVRGESEGPFVRIRAPSGSAWIEARSLVPITICT